MAWQHFTDWLKPGDIITKNQRNELIDALRERYIAVPDLASRELPDASFRDSDILTARWGNKLIHEWIGEMRNRYLADYQGNEIDVVRNWDTERPQANDENDIPENNIWWHAAQTLGVSWARMIDIGLGATSGSGWDVTSIPTADYFNLCREVVRLMKHPEIVPDFEIIQRNYSYQEFGFPSGLLSWEDLKQHYYENDPSPSSTRRIAFSFYSNTEGAPGFQWFYQGYTGRTFMPAHVELTGEIYSRPYSLFAYQYATTVGSRGNTRYQAYEPVTVYVEFSSESDNYKPNNTDGLWVMKPFFSGLTDSGMVEMNVWFPAFDESTDIDNEIDNFRWDAENVYSC